MLELLAANMGTIIVAAIVIAIVAVVIAVMVRDKKAGKSSCSCGGGCSSCPGSSICHGGK